MTYKTSKPAEDYPNEIKCKSCGKVLYHHYIYERVMFCDEDCLSDYVMQCVKDPDYFDDSDYRYEQWRDRQHGF